jgi:hypothetical protein
MSELNERAHEIAAFFGIPEEQAIERLSKGFGYQHQRVNEDFRRCNPQTDEELLNWYRTTEQYIWELSAYHLDPGFNYAGMCRGIAERLKGEGAYAVLCLGDGIGDLTLSLKAHGFDPVYHDLQGSKTAAFALSRIKKVNQAKGPMGLDVHHVLTAGWDPILIGFHFDAIVSLDFLEHVVDVPEWCLAVAARLKIGGVFVAQNAFAIGSGPDGSIPMHLARNDRFERDWDPLLASLGFEALSPQWYRKVA